MNKIKMIAFDLDGTLLTTDKSLTEYTRDVLERAAAQGLEVIPATGRPLTGVPEVFFRFPGIRYIVTSNGARTIRTADRETLEVRLLSLESAKEIMAVFKEYDTMRDIFYDGQGYTEKEKLAEVERYLAAPAMAEYVRASRIPLADIDRKLAEENRPVDKVQALFADPAERMEALKRIRKIAGAEPSYAIRNNIEVNGAGVHKGMALISLGERLGIRREEILAFGDGTNDIRMLKESGIGVAMENAPQEVKDAADAVTLSNDEDGVAAYIEKYVLNPVCSRKE